MGSSRREGGRRANEIQREALLQRPFYLSVKEVTNSEFRQFLANHASKPFNGNELNKDEQPVADVGWATAATYCNWLSRARRITAILPDKIWRSSRDQPRRDRLPVANGSRVGMGRKSAPQR